MPYWWIAPTILAYTLLAYESQLCNSIGGYHIYMVWVLGALPLWAIISRHSANLAFDGLLYDSIMTITYSISILYYTDSLKNIGINALLGGILIIAGLVIFRIGM